MNASGRSAEQAKDHHPNVAYFSDDNVLERQAKAIPVQVA